MRILSSILLATMVAACGPMAGSEIETVEGRDDLLVGIHYAKIENGLSGKIRFEVPEDSESLLIELRGSKGLYFLTEFETPSGRELIEGADYQTRGAREVPGLVDWLYPNDPSDRLEAGEYSLVVRGETASGDRLGDEGLEVRIYSKMPQDRHCGLKLDFLVDYSAISVEDFDRAAEELVAGLLPLFGQIDVNIIDYQVSSIDLSSPDIQFDGSTSVVRIVDDILGQARRSNTLRPDSIHVIMVRSIGGAADPAGYSMGLPGPFDASQPTSAVLIATEPYVRLDGFLDIDGLVTTLAHEMGHYLGLYHTSERNGNYHDPIDDTPQCDGLLCADHFDRNIMTPGTGARRNSISAGQGDIVRRHPLCQPSAPPAIYEVPTCTLDCEAPNTCAVWNGEPQCLEACDNQAEFDTCPDASFCTAAEDGAWVCRPE